MLTKTLIFFSLASFSLLADTIFQAVDLGTLGTNAQGAGSASGVALNASGQVIGQSLANGNPNFQHAFSSTGGLMSNLGVLNFGPSGMSHTLVHDINNNGLVVGQSTTYSGIVNLGDRAVVWDGTSLNNLGTFGTNSQGGGYSVAWAINDSGVAVGSSSQYTNSGTLLGKRAFKWSAVWGLTNLGVVGTNLSGFGSSEALDINNSGKAVGYSSNYNGNTSLGTSAVVFENGQTTVIPWLAANSSGGGSASATLVNQAGVVAGNSTLGNRGTRGFVYNGGILTSVGSLGEDSYGNGSSLVTGLNEAGTVVGNSELYVNGQSQGERGYVWSNGIIVSMGLLPGSNGPGSYSEANAVNASGQAVGRSTTGAQQHATWWSNGILYDLNDLAAGLNGFVLENAVDINNFGQILANGTNYTTNQTRTFLLGGFSNSANTPEPQTYLLTGLGLIVLGGLRRRMKDC